MIRERSMPGNPITQIQKLLKTVWGKWDIQTIVLASLGFQITLVLLAPLRKFSKRNSTSLIIWFVYLNAEYCATFAIGLINTSGGSSYITAFWAAFLLLHLGGPHTITSFAIEDNDLWHRHLLTLVIQVFSVILVFYKRQIYNSREFLIPTLIIFVIGIVKYAERTRSLYLASLPIMRRAMREAMRADSRAETGEQDIVDVEASVEERDDVEIVYRGYRYYLMFRGFILDHTFIHIQRDEAKKYFLKLRDEDAFEIIGAELNFMYDAMFTKMAAVQWISSFGYAYRFVFQAALIVVTVMFINRNKHRVETVDIAITYLLLAGAVVLDFIALVKLIFSEWTIAIMMDELHKAEEQSTQESFLANPAEMFKDVRKWVLWLKRNRKIMKIISFIKIQISSKKRWSKMIRQYSLINQALNERWEWVDRYILHQLGLTERVDSCQYTKIAPVDSSLMKLVFHHIKEAHLQDDEDQDQSAIGRPPSGGEAVTELWKICSAIDHHPYDNRVLILHVATEICYFMVPKEPGDPNPEICKSISEYLAYLLVMEGRITSTVPGNVGMRFRDICWEEVEDTCQELSLRFRSRETSYFDYIKYMINSTLRDFREFLNPANRKTKNAAGPSNKILIRRAQHIKSWDDMQRTRACEWLLWQMDKEDAKTESKSVLSDAVQLARNLKDYRNYDDPTTADCSKEVWRCLSHMWVKLLLYASSHCRGDVQYLTKGGELVTFVRLLMAHFGLRKWFRDEGGSQSEAESNQRNVLRTTNDMF